MASEILRSATNKGYSVTGPITAKYGSVITAVWGLALSIISVKAFRQN